MFLQNMKFQMTDSPTDLFRILDASANRTREGLRVVEDFVRFALNDAHLSRFLKECRHELAAILAMLPSSSLLAARDTLSDVGTTISTPAETLRTTTLDVVRASFKRIQEALRTLEEYGKIVDPKIASRFEQLRYQIYTAEKAVLRTEAARSLLHDQRVYLLITSALCECGLEAVVKSSLDAGVRLFQLREKTMPDRELVSLARAVRAWTAQAGALLIINDRPDIAVLARADGVHVGQDELTVQDARTIVGPDRLVGVSTHSIEQAQRAVIEGADYIGVGPTFSSGTKTFEDFPGLDLIRCVASEISLPWFAIGGIDDRNAPDVKLAGATRIAVSGTVCRSRNPADAVRQLAFV